MGVYEAIKGSVGVYRGMEKKMETTMLGDSTAPATVMNPRMENQIETHMEYEMETRGLYGRLRDWLSLVFQLFFYHDGSAH